MAHNYEITREDNDLVVYRKTHDNGETTDVRLEQTGTEAGGGTSWLVLVKDPNGNQRLGKRTTKRSARSLATKWMNNHPKGVTSGSGSVLPGVDDGGMFGL